MDLGLQGKRALITGGTSGIGFAISSAMAAEGASIIVASRTPQNIERAVESLRKQFPKVSVDGVSVDLANSESIQAAIKSFNSQTIDILVNNTGGPATGLPLDISVEQWDRGYQTLLRSVVLLSQALIPPMQKRGWGRVLTITSTSARQLIPRLPVSSTFRAGLTAWTKEVAKQVGKSGVLVNNLLPGPTKTDRLQELETKSPQFYQSMIQESALGRIADPIEIGRMAAFLCSAANTYVTGTDVLVDGGYTGAL